MHLNKMHLENFMSFQELDLDFADVQGVSLIEGVNHDDTGLSSGSGKTSLIDGIAFVMFGDSPRGIKANEFVNDQAGKQCLGRLEITMDDGQPLTIQRTRKPEDLYFQIGENEPVRDINLIKTQTLLEDFIKLNFDTFCNSVYFAQNAKMKFISAKDSDKRDILTRILDLSDYDKALEIAKEKSKQLETLKVNKMMEQAQKQSNLTSIEYDLQHAKTSSDVFEDGKLKDLKRKQDEKAVFEKNIVEKQAYLEFLKSKTFDIPVFDLPLPNTIVFDAKMDMATRKKQALERAKQGIVPPDLTEFQKKIDLEPQLKQKEKEYSAAYTTAEVKAKSIREKVSKIKDLGEGECPHCFSIVTKDHLSAYLSKCAVEIIGLDADKDTSESKLEKVRVALNNVQEIKDQKETLLRDYASKRLQLDQLIMVADKEILSIESEKQKELQMYQNKKQEYEKKTKQVELDRINNSHLIDQTKAYMDSCDKALKTIDQDMESIKTRKNTNLDLIKIKETQRDSVKKELEETQDFLSKCDSNIEAMEVLKQSYKNVKYFIFESTIDELNRRIGKYLDPMFNEDVKLEYQYISGKNTDNLKFSTRIWKNGMEKSYESLSDGEKKRTELATSFALSDIVSMRKSNSLSLMILDECFSGLDEGNRERIVGLLEVLKDEKDTILVIDHFKSIQTLIENTIKVEKRDGISRLT